MEFIFWFDIINFIEVSNMVRYKMIYFGFCWCLYYFLDFLMLIIIKWLKLFWLEFVFELIDVWVMLIFVIEINVWCKIGWFGILK